MTPAHIAIIMDGNGRWAKARGLPRAAGHRAGVDALRQTVRTAGDLGVKWLTVYAFSSENWSRPASEVSDLLGLLKLFIRRDLAELHQAGVRVRVIGSRSGLKADIIALIAEAEYLTRANTGLTLVIAFNYGARDEILRAARQWAEDAAAGKVKPQDLDAAAFAERLDTHGIPDPDLVIRTSGEQRLSNFLLWQAAYSELVFSPCYWPDFNQAEMTRALAEFESRDRRYGGAGKAEAAS